MSQEGEGRGEGGGFVILGSVAFVSYFSLHHIYLVRAEYLNFQPRSERVKN